MEETWQMFLSLSVENLKHDHVQQSSRRQALQGVDHQIGDMPGPELGDEDPSCDTQGTGEAEYSEVGVEDGLLGVGLQKLQADTEGDDKLVTGDGCNK